jgi:O-antigen ligase
VYLLVFILLEPSRNLSLGNYVILGSVNLKYYEIVLALLYLGAVVNPRRPITACIRPSMAVFLLFALVSLVRGVPYYGEAAFNQFRPLVSMGMCSVMPLLFRRPADLKPVLRFFAVVMLLAGSVDVLEILRINPLSAWIQSGTRSMSVLGGTQGSMLAMVFLYLLAEHRTIIHHRFVVMGAISYAGVLAVLSASRGVWMGMISGVSCMVWFLPLRRKATMMAMAGLLVLFILAFFKSVQIERYNMSIYERWDSMFDPQEGTTRWRLDAWRAMMDDIRERPLSGWPLGSEPYFYVYSGGYYEAVAPHNEYLKIARYTGLPGLAAFLWFIVGIVVTAARYLVRHLNTPMYYEVLGLLACFIMHTVISMVTQQFTTIDISAIIWALPGMISVYVSAGREEEAAAAAAAARPVEA